MIDTDQTTFEKIACLSPGAHVSDFISCSESYGEDGAPYIPPRFCLPTSCRAGAIKCFSFDELVDDWNDRKAKLERHENVCASVDALYPKCDELYLVEFKNAKSTKNANSMKFTLHRKLYDSILSLIERGVLTVSACRKKVNYVVVMPNMPKLQAKDIELGENRGLSEDQRAVLQNSIFLQVASFISRPWRCSQIRSQFMLWSQEGVICKKTYTVSPLQFDAFVKDIGWV